MVWRPRPQPPPLKGVTGEGSSKVRGRGEGEAWGSGVPGVPGARLPGNQTPSPRARRMAGEEGVTSGSTKGCPAGVGGPVRSTHSFLEPPPADGSDCTFPISDGGRGLWSEKLPPVNLPGLWGTPEAG